MQTYPDDYRPPSPNHPGAGVDALSAPLSGPLEPPRLLPGSSLTPRVPGGAMSPVAMSRDELDSMLRHPSRSPAELVDGPPAPAIYPLGSLWEDPEGDIWAADESGYLILLTVGATPPKWGPQLIAPQKPSEVIQDFGPLAPLADHPARHVLRPLYQAQQRIAELQRAALVPRGARIAELESTVRAEQAGRQRVIADLELRTRELAQAREDYAGHVAQLEQIIDALRAGLQQAADMHGVGPDAFVQLPSKTTDRHAMLTAAADLADQGSALMNLSHQLDRANALVGSQTGMLEQAQAQLRAQLAEIDRLTREHAELESAHRDCVVDLDNAQRAITNLSGQLRVRNGTALEDAQRWAELVELRAKVEHGNANEYEPYDWDRFDGPPQPDTIYRFAHSVALYGPPPWDWYERVNGAPMTTGERAELERMVTPAGRAAVAAIAAMAGAPTDHPCDCAGGECEDEPAPADVERVDGEQA